MPSKHKNENRGIQRAITTYDDFVSFAKQQGRAEKDLKNISNSDTLLLNDISVIMIHNLNNNSAPPAKTRYDLNNSNTFIISVIVIHYWSMIYQ